MAPIYEHKQITPLEKISHFLASVRKRARLVHCIRCTGIFCAILAMLLLILILIASVLDYHSPLRLLGLSLLLPLTLGYLVYLIIGVSRLSEQTVIVKLVGKKRPKLHSDLLSTVELEQRVNSKQARFSIRLFEALVQKTWQRLRQLSPKMLVPSKHLRSTATLLSIAALAWAIVATGLSGHVRHGATRLLSRSFVNGARVSTRLLVGDLKLSYHYPRYMARNDRVVESSSGNITAPKGTRIRITATTLLPITTAALVLHNRGSSKPKQLDLSLEKGRLLSGELILKGDGMYQFKITIPDGEAILDPMTRRIQIEPDVLPKVSLYGPRNNLEVTTEHHLEIGFTVEDDYGLKNIDLVYQVGSRSPRRVRLWKPQKRVRVTAGKHNWDLGSVELFPGARVAYWIEVQDNDTISGPKIGRSSTLYFSVYSAEKKHAQTMRQQEMLIERAMRSLADRLLLFAKTPTINPTDRVSKAMAIHRASASLVDGLRELRNQMRKDALVSKITSRSINQLSRRLVAPHKIESKLLRQLEGARRRDQVRQAQLGPLRDQNRKLVALMELLVLRLANLLDEQRLQSLINLHRNIQKTRKRLSDLLERYRKTREDKLRSEILRQIQHMEEKIKELMARAAKLSRGLPHEYLNAEAMQGMDLLSDLRHIASMVQEGKLGDLESTLRALDRKLDQMQSVLAGNLQEFRKGRMSAHERAYSALLDELRGLENEQRQISRSTQHIIRRYHQRAAQLMQHKINPFVQKELKKLARLQKLVGEINSSWLASYDQEQLQRIKQRIRDLKGMLDQGDLDQALRMALRTRNGLQVLQDDLSEELEGQGTRRYKRVLKTLKKSRAARRLAEELISDLKNIFPSPRMLLKYKDRLELQDLLKDQRALKRKLRQLSAQLSNKQKTFQLGSEIKQGMHEAKGLMGKAAGKLKRLQPQEAFGSQEAAAERLSRIRKQVQAARQPQQWSSNGPSVLRERIQIPGADAFRPPKEFRRDLLEAMKEKAPQAYEQQVRKYYEELVR